MPFCGCRRRKRSGSRGEEYEGILEGLMGSRGSESEGACRRFAAGDAGRGGV
jgi:hypothetical protein